MVTYISSWARQVILAVVIGILLEMILSPNSKSTKYIKTVIGIYVMYTIIAPGLKLVGGKSIDFSNINYEDYFNNSEIYEKMESNIAKIEDDNFKESYELNLKQDMETKLNKKGFIVSDIDLEIELDENSEEYGVIRKINIGILKKENKEKEISVNKIKVGEEIAEKTSLSEKEESEIKSFLNQEYGIDYKNIELKTRSE